MATYKLYYFKDKKTGKKRNTPVVSTSVKSARRKLRRPSPKNAVVYAVRTPTASERRQGASGRWITTRASGKNKRKSPVTRGFGPKPKKRK